MKHLLLLISLVLTTHFLPAQTSAGNFDTTFGNNGRSLTNFSGSGDYMYSAKMQPDGKTVVVGVTETYFAHLLVVRYLSDGSLDTNFGIGGIQTLTFDAKQCYGSTLAIQADGKILVAGVIVNSTNDFIVARLHPNGNLDTTFGTNGYVSTNISGDDSAMCMLLQPDGKIIVAGGTNNGNANIVRYLNNGNLDTSFSADGKVITSFTGYSDVITGIIYTTDNKIIVSGYSYEASSNDIIIGKYNDDGSLDTSFDTDGIIVLNYEAESYVYHNSGSIHLLPNNKFVVLGSRTIVDNDEFNATQLIALRYHTDGTPDLIFGDNGLATSDLLPDASNWDGFGYIQDDGKIVHTGALFNSNGIVNSFLVRWNENGSLDNSFGLNGIALFDIADGCSEGLYSPFQLANGKIIAAGNYGEAYLLECETANNGDLMLVRINENGSIDNSFGNNGVVVNNIAGNGDEPFQLNIINGKPTICGHTVAMNSTTASYIAGLVAQFNADGTLNTNFGTGGKTIVSQPSLGYSSNAYNMTTDDNNRLLVATVHFDGTAAYSMVRLMPDGSFDTSFGIDGRVVIENSGLRFAYCIATNGDKIIIGGNAADRFGLIQLNNDGSLDTTFGTNGITITDMPGAGDRIWTVKRLADGSILAGGTAGGTWALYRYTNNGILDNTFSATATCNPISGRIYELIELANGKILVAGAPFLQTPSEFNIVQLNADGSPDINFGTNGVFSLPFDQGHGYATTMALYPDQSKIIIGGHFNDQEINVVSALVQLNPNGTLDTDFGNNGVLMADTLYHQFIEGSLFVIQQRIAFDDNNKLVMASSREASINNKDVDVYLARFLTDLSVGVLDIESVANAVYTYPNPLHNNQLTIAYELKQAQTVQITLYDLLGKQVAQLQNPTPTQSGSHKHSFELPSNVSNGVYILSLQTANGNVSVKITIDHQ